LGLCRRFGFVQRSPNLESIIISNLETIVSQTVSVLRSIQNVLQPRFIRVRQREFIPKAQLRHQERQHVVASDADALTATLKEIRA